jgi:hypothetical protein
MEDTPQGFFADHAGLARLCLVALACAGLSALFIPALAGPNRGMAILALALTFAGAAGFELLMRGRSMDAAAAAVIAIFTLAASAWMLAGRFDPLLDPQGPLRAARDPMPRNACGGERLGQGDWLVVLGRDAVIAHGTGPLVPAMLGSCPLMRLTRDAQGGVTANGFGYDSDGNLIYRIRDNRFGVVLRGFQEGVRPDAATLDVTGPRFLSAATQHRQVEFSVRYLNARAVRISGTFRCGDAPKLVIGDAGITMGGKSVPAGACLHAPEVLYFKP